MGYTEENINLNMFEDYDEDPNEEDQEDEDDDFDPDAQFKGVALNNTMNSSRPMAAKKTKKK